MNSVPILGVGTTPDPLGAHGVPRGDGGDLRDVAEGFEALFLRQMLAAARKADFGGEQMFSSQGEDTFREMLDSHFADVASDAGSFGIADMLEAQLARSIGGVNVGGEDGGL